MKKNYLYSASCAPVDLAPGTKQPSRPPLTAALVVQPKHIPSVNVMKLVKDELEH